MNPSKSRSASSRGTSLAARVLGAPTRVRVRVGREGVPQEVDGHGVELVRESWLVEDRWWTGRPLRRRYWEVVSMRGRNFVVYHDLTPAGRGPMTPAGTGSTRGDWFTQAG